jgi:hypothetical protein
MGRQEITRNQLNEFLVRAIGNAAGRECCGVNVNHVDITELGNVRIDLANGDIVVIDIEHLVQREPV